MHIMHNYSSYMQEILLQRIKDIEDELNELYNDLEASDYNQYGQHIATTSKILKKSEELAALKNGLDLVS